VEVAELPAPPGVTAGRGHALPVPQAQVEAVTAESMPLRLPETVTQGQPDPGRLWVRLDSFEEYHFAAALRARLAGLGAQIVQVPSGRSYVFRVDIGPLDDVRQADAVLDQALAAGVPDARIVVQ
jgi:cell division protein FtsN